MLANKVHKAICPTMSGMAPNFASRLQREDWGKYVDLKGEPGTENGDITGVTAGDGLTGGGDEGEVTLSIPDRGLPVAKMRSDGVPPGQVITSTGDGGAVWQDGSPNADPIDHGTLDGLLDDDHPQYLLRGETDSVSGVMLQDGGVGLDKLTSNGASAGWVVKFDGSAISWAPDEVGGGNSPWEHGNQENIYYSPGGVPQVGIGTSEPDAALEVHGDVKIVDNGQSGPTVDVAGDVHVADGLDVDSDINVGSALTVDGDVDVGDDLYVVGYATIGEDLRVYEDLQVGENLSGTELALDVNGDASIADSLNVHGSTFLFDELVVLSNISSGSGTPVVVASNGRLYKQSSSLRYKHNVIGLPSSTAAVLALRPVTFNWNATGERDIGLIAEEVAEIVPELVLYDAEDRPDAG
ncbi:tail fiber domain-containing protein [uncultured Ilyobacter sp.]|uniref:tail fiber domain-containing protein n=1 Tax=uncultured Ilyobacter sp. TaxID=544433 RepID=UPI0029F4D9B3|nr:tail fiber domain-containing protein [uncultured Ilyobacter sp.]